MSKRSITLVISLISLILAVIYALFIRPQVQFQESLHVYPRSQLIFEDSSTYWGESRQKNLYYFTQDHLGDVEKYYDAFFPAFVLSEDEYGKWFITAFNIDGLQATPNPSLSFLQHKTFCEDLRDYGCITVSLVNTSQSDLYNLAISSPSIFRYLTPPPALASLPLDATLIIYSYWIPKY